MPSRVARAVSGVERAIDRAVSGRTRMASRFHRATTRFADDAHRATTTGRTEASTPNEANETTTTRTTMATATTTSEGGNRRDVGVRTLSMMEGEERTASSPARSRSGEPRSREAALEALQRELDETEALLNTRRVRELREQRSSAGAADEDEESRATDRDVADATGAQARRTTPSFARARWGSLVAVVAACACILAIMIVRERPEARARRRLHMSSLSEMQCEHAFVPALSDNRTMDSSVNRIIAAAHHVYVLTSQNCASPNVTLRVPDAYASKATCVSGGVLDRCAAMDTGVWWESHYTRVSMAHGMMIKHAKEQKYNNIVVMEEDTTVNHEVNIHPDTEADMLKLLREDFDTETSSLGRVQLELDEHGSLASWNVIRPAFRPHLFEKFETRKQGKGYIEVTTGVKDVTRCPSQCACRNTQEGGQLCALSAAGCDLRSSDMYMLHSRAYDLMLPLLFVGTDETIIDHFVLQNIPKTWLLHPSVTIQAHLDISHALQLKVQDEFERKCVK